MAVKARFGLLADGSAIAQRNVTGGVGNVVPEIIRASCAGDDDMSITATPDSWACVVDAERTAARDQDGLRGVEVVEALAILHPGERQVLDDLVRARIDDHDARVAVAIGRGVPPVQRDHHLPRREDRPVRARRKLRRRVRGEVDPASDRPVVRIDDEQIVARSHRIGGAAFLA